MARESIGLAQVAEMGKLPSKAALISNLRAFGNRGLSGARVTESGGSGIVIHKVANPFPCVPDLPTFRKRILIL